VLIDRIDGHHVVRTIHEIGGTSPMHATPTDWRCSPTSPRRRWRR
jgi:hypothetical protein